MVVHQLHGSMAQALQTGAGWPVQSVGVSMQALAKHTPKASGGAKLDTKDIGTSPRP